MADPQQQFEPRPGDPVYEYEAETGGWTRPVEDNEPDND